MVDFTLSQARMKGIAFQEGQKRTILSGFKYLLQCLILFIAIVLMKALIIMSLGVLYAVRRKGHFPLKAIYIFQH